MKRRPLQLAASMMLAAFALSLALVPTGCSTGASSSPGASSSAGSSAIDARTAKPVVASGWLNWRGPHQNGNAGDGKLPAPATIDGQKPTWRYDLSGRGTPVLANGHLYTLGYEGEGKELEEVLVCLDAATGKKVWERRFQHFLTDIIYYRFAIGSPTIDPTTGNVFCMTSSGLLCSFTPDGELRWQRALTAEYGRLIFPNGRTGAVALNDDFAILHMTTSGWGPQGPARGRFFAFDKDTGDCAWTATPGGPPKDISFSMPVFEWRNGRQLVYAGLSGGHMTCVDARSGDAMWRFPMCTGGMSSSAVLYKDTLIAIHGKENLDTSTGGRMVAIQLGAEPGADQKPLVLGKEHEKWRNGLTAFTSSPVLVGNRVFSTVATGELACVDADTGKVLWEHKLAPDQIHASPAFGDGKLWVPMNNGSFFVIEASDEGAKVLAETQLGGNCLGAPAICSGQVFVHTTEALYCFGSTRPGPGSSGQGSSGQDSKGQLVQPREVGSPSRLQILPADLVARTGETVQFRVRTLDANGNTVSETMPTNITWSSKEKQLEFLPVDPRGTTLTPPGSDEPIRPDAPLTKSMVVTTRGTLRIAKDTVPMAFVLKATSGKLTGTARVRVVPDAPYTDDFEDVALKPHPKEDGVQFAFPRSHWISAKLKWEVRERDGSKVLARTLDRPLFQRTISMIGAPEMSNYTMQVDVMTDGNRRTMSTPGMVNQRYLILLKGNHQALEITSNEELLKERVKFRWKPKIWYRLKSRVDVKPDGSGVVRAKAWQRDQPEPDGWLLEVDVPRANRNGSPGLYGFTPQSRFRCYLDNIVVTPND